MLNQKCRMGPRNVSTLVPDGEKCELRIFGHGDRGAEGEGRWGGGREDGIIMCHSESGIV
jgi:hypothetical protein